MDLKEALRNGMRVVGPDNREYGTIERYDDSAAYVRGKRVPFAAIERLENDRLHVDTPELWGLTSSADMDSLSAKKATATADLGGEIRVPLLEEQLEFATREIDLGEIRIHKTVEETEEARSGQLNREDADVERVRVDRRVTEPEESRQEGDWLIIPVMEEVFVVEKHLMVTEEIRIRKRLGLKRPPGRAALALQRVSPPVHRYRIGCTASSAPSDSYPAGSVPLTRLQQSQAGDLRYRQDRNRHGSDRRRSVGATIQLSWDLRPRLYQGSALQDAKVDVPRLATPTLGSVNAMFSVGAGQASNAGNRWVPPV